MTNTSGSFVPNSTVRILGKCLGKPALPARHCRRAGFGGIVDSFSPESADVERSDVREGGLQGG